MHGLRELAAALLFLLPGPVEPPDPATARFAELGYRVREAGHREPTEWERNELGIRTVRFWLLRSVEPLSRDSREWTSQVWYRFEVTREGFDTEEAAKARLPRLLETPPGADVPKSFPLRVAFQRGSHVFVISTDVSMFEPEMARLLARLREQPPD